MFHHWCPSRTDEAISRMDSLRVQPMMKKRLRKMARALGLLACLGLLSLAGWKLFLGDNGTLMCGCYGLEPRLIPEKRMKEFKPPTPTIERIPGGQEGHEKDWVRACKGGKPASSNFDYRAMHLIPLTPLLGVCSAN